MAQSGPRRLQNLAGGPAAVKESPNGNGGSIGVGCVMRGFAQRTAVGSASNSPKKRTVTCIVVMAGQVAVIHRLTDRRVVQLPISSDASLIARTLQAHDVRYVVIADRLPFEYFEPDEETRLQLLQAAYPSLLRETQRGRGYRIFAVHR